MFRITVCVCAFLLLACCVLPMAAQQPAAASANVAVPPMVNFSGVLTDVNGKPMTGTVGVTFYLYKDSQGGAPLWMETQNVKADKAGHYTAALGATNSQGMPANVFASGEARWLGVQAEGQAEQPRVLLMSVPYAMKALDAETIGGKPLSALMLAPAGSSASGKGAAAPGTITGSGTADFVPVFTGTTTIGNSKIFQTVAGEIGIGTTTPSAKLDVKGTEDVRDTITLFPKSTHPVLTIHGTALSVDHTGLVTFVSGQTFPGTGTVTSVGSGAGLTGGPITTSGTLSIKTGGVTNAMLAHSSLTVTANSPLTGGGSVSLGGSTSLGLESCATGQILKWNGSAWACAADNNSGGTVTSVGSGLGLTGGPITSSGTLSINTSVVPQLAAANTFTNLNAISVSSGSPALSITNGSTGDGLSITAGSGFGVLVNNTGFGVVATNSDIPILAEAPSSGAESVLAFAADDSNLLPAVFGIEEGTTTRTVGVEGATDSPVGFGVYGQNVSESSAGSNCSSHFVACQAGVWGDGGTATFNTGVLGTVDNGFAGFFTNTSTGEDTLVAWAQSGSANPFFAGNLANNTHCFVDSGGSLNCTGSKNAVVPIDGGARTVALSAIESPMNWFEDFGSAQLVNGVAVVRLDPEFIQTVNSETDYKVFPVPNGDCKGLYITHKTATSFEVRELGGGTSSVAFDYRITALRKNYESVRFADHTHDMDSMKRMLQHGPAIPTKAPAPPQRPRVAASGRMAQLSGVVKH